MTQLTEPLNQDLDPASGAAHFGLNDTEILYLLGADDDPDKQYQHDSTYANFLEAFLRCNMGDNDEMRVEAVRRVRESMDEIMFCRSYGQAASLGEEPQFFDLHLYNLASNVLKECPSNRLLAQQCLDLITDDYLRSRATVLIEHYSTPEDAIDQPTPTTINFTGSIAVKRLVAY